MKQNENQSIANLPINKDQILDELTAKYVYGGSVTFTPIKISNILVVLKPIHIYLPPIISCFVADIGVGN